MSGNTIRTRFAFPGVDKHIIDSYIKNAKIVGVVVVSDFLDDGIREPATDQIGMPSGGLVKTSVVAILNVHSNASTRNMAIARHTHVTKEGRE